jgi:uncharacterized protein YegL
MDSYRPTTSIDVKQTKSFIFVRLTPSKISNIDHFSVPMNLVVVADCSGSMQGQKIDYLKQAIVQLVDQLNSKDRLTLISYNYQSKIHFAKQQPKVDNTQLIDQIKLLSAKDDTNMYDALKSVYSYCEEEYDSSAINQIFFFSDGRPTSGKIIDEKLLLEYQMSLHSKFTDRKQSLYFTCYGIGHDYNGHFLRKLTFNGNGHFYYICNHEDTFNLIKDGLKIAHTITSRTNIIKLINTPKLKLHSANGFLFDRGVVNLGPIYDQPISLLFEIKNAKKIKSGTYIGNLLFYGQFNQSDLKLYSVDDDDQLLEQYHQIALISNQINQAIQTQDEKTLNNLLDQLKTFEKDEDLKSLVQKYLNIICSYLDLMKNAPLICRQSATTASTIDDLHASSGKCCLQSIGLKVNNKFIPIKNQSLNFRKYQEQEKIKSIFDD